MARIVVSDFVSLDGVMEDPGGSEGTPSGGWAFKFERGADGDAYKLEELRDAEAMLLGRVTYEGFAEKMNGMPKYVVSSTLERADWQNSTILPGDPVAEATALRGRLAGNILVAGSTSLVHTLHDAGLVDEYRLMIYPTVLGSGKRLFRDGAGAAGYEAVEVRPAGAVALMTLRPLADGGAAAA